MFYQLGNFVIFAHLVLHLYVIYSSIMSLTPEENYQSLYSYSSQLQSVT